MQQTNYPQYPQNLVFVKLSLSISQFPQDEH